MEINKCTKASFSVIGKEGSTKDGNGFIQQLWGDANSHFSKVSNLAKKDKQGNVLGVWGLMSDFTHSYKPWEDHFSKGLYLAGVEVNDEATAPEGWVKWTVPSYEYIYVINENPDTFSKVINYLSQHKIPLAGAVHEFNCPETGNAYLFFPIKKF